MGQKNKSKRNSVDFRAEKRSAQASAHLLSQAQGGLFCVLTVLAGLKNDCACVLICGKERRLKRTPIQNDCRFAGNKQAAFKSKK